MADPIDFSSAFSDLTPAAKQATDFGNSFADLVPAKAAPKGMIGQALEPITSYPSTYKEMSRQSLDQMIHGFDQLMSAGKFAVNKTPEGMSEKDQTAAGAGQLVRGLGNTVVGAAGYISSPINAAIHTVVGQPVENVTGIPSKYTDFAAGMALPIPKRLPAGAGTATTAERATTPTAQELRTAATAGYESPEVAGLSVKAPAVQSWSDRARATLTEAGLDENVAPKTWKILEKADKAPVDAFATGKNIDSLRKTLGHAASSTEPAERLAASRAIESADDFLSNLSKTDVIAGDPAAAAATLTEARGNYAAAKRSEAITTAAEKADLNAVAANSGQNVDNAVRQRIKSILQDPKQRRGYSQDELARMDSIVRGTFVGNTSRFLGNLFGGGGGLGTVVTAGTGAAAAGPVGAIAPIFGYGFKKLGNAITAREVAKLDELVRSRSPFARQVGAPLQDWSMAAQAAEVSPTPRNVARLTVASRNLSNNLSSAGISVSPDDLLRSLQGPMRGAAEDEQP